VLDSGIDVRPRLLTQFVVLAHRGDLARAAEDLQTTPRALRKAVGDLERHAGETLLTETGRQLVPTPAGVRLARSARRVLDAVDRFEGLARTDRSTVRIAHVANADTTDILLDEAAGLDRWVRAAEQVAPDDRQLEDLAAHRLDVAVCTMPGALPDDLDRCRLRLDPLVAARQGSSTVESEGPGTPLLAPAYGQAWPAHDAAVAAYAQASERAIEWVTVPVGSGRETSALLREAGDRQAIIASSALGTSRPVVTALPSPQPYLTWWLVWRRADTAPALKAFVAAAEREAHRRGWLSSPDVRD
jgi:DNA-binding transcriptional LysR family regulator